MVTMPSSVGYSAHSIKRLGPGIESLGDGASNSNESALVSPAMLEELVRQAGAHPEATFSLSGDHVRLLAMTALRAARGTLNPGTIVGSRFRLDRPIGEGGMGAVWAATHTSTGRRYALKFVKGPTHLKPDLRRRLMREARAAIAVDHPNIVRIHDVLELDEDAPILVMDLLEGETLGMFLAERPMLSLEEIASILVPVVSAVGSAHALGVVHRDLKPDNIFLARDGGGAPSAYVLDFGIAKFTPQSEHDTGSVTGTGTVFGTPCYMSPEQVFGESDIDDRADIWALGVILYEALAGARPVEGDNQGQVLKRIVSDGIVPIQALVPDLPDDISKLSVSMLSRERTARPSDLISVLDVLERYTNVRARRFGPPLSRRPVQRAMCESSAAASGVILTPAGEQMQVTSTMPATRA